MSQRTSDVEGQPVIAQRELFVGPTPHAIIQGNPDRLDESTRWIASDTMYDLDRCL